MIRVVNVRGLRGPAREGVVYVGRPFAGWSGHKLGNPFKMKSFGAGGACQNIQDEWNRKERARVLAEYRAWLMARPTLESDLEYLWLETVAGNLPLGCWCHPEPCHADVLADLLNDRFPG